EQRDWLGHQEEEVLNRNVLKPSRLFVYMPKSITNRVTTQLSFLTIHPDNDGRFDSLENQLDSSVLRQICIPRNSFPPIRPEPDRMGVNRFSIFPDPGGLARHVRWYPFAPDDEGR